MAHIEKRLRGSKLTYRARYRDPAGRERSKTFTRRVDAERFVVEVEHAKSRGAWVDPTLGRITFAAWLDQWWATTTNLRESTQARDKASLRVHAIPRFGRIPLSAIRQIEVRALEGGYLEKICVKEGQSVKKGDLLFKILPVLYEAKLATEDAEVQRMKIELDNAEDDAGQIRVLGSVGISRSGDGLVGHDTAGTHTVWPVDIAVGILDVGGGGVHHRCTPDRRPECGAQAGVADRPTV